MSIRNFVPEWIKRIVRRHVTRNRFPTCVFHHGVIVGRDCRFENYVVCFNESKIELGSSVGRYSYIQSGTVIWNAEIGAFCSIARNVTIGLVGHPTFMVSTHPVFYDNEQSLPKSFVDKKTFTSSLPRTVLGADVWVGQDVMIKAGVRIGTGSVIGAGAVVTKDIPPYVIAAGNPCRVIRPRFSDAISQGLLSSKWWEFSEDGLVHTANTFSDPELFLSTLDSRDLHG